MAPGVEDHIRTAAAGFEMPEEILRQIMSLTLVGRPGVAVYVGYTDGQPVTTGLGVRTGRTIGVYNIATIRSARKRGYGAAMTMRIAEDGAAHGCDVAVLQASEIGYPIYERLGYRTVAEYMGYVDPSSVEPLDVEVLTGQREKAHAMRRELARGTRAAARALRHAGLSTQDVGEILGISGARVAQIDHEPLGG